MSFADVAAQNVDLQFDLWAAAATYTPPSGGPANCRIVLAMPQEIEPIGAGRVVRDRRLAKVRASDVASPASGGVFTLGTIVDGVFIPSGESYRIFSDPRREDPRRLVWTCEVAPV